MNNVISILFQDTSCFFAFIIVVAVLVMMVSYLHKLGSLSDDRRGTPSELAIEIQHVETKQIYIREPGTAQRMIATGNYVFFSQGMQTLNEPYRKVRTKFLP